jgi:transaldolase
MEPTKKLKTEGGSALDQLKKHSQVVADTGDFNEIAKFAPQDATTNPSLILQACQLPQYLDLINDSIDYARKNYKGYGKPPSRSKSAKKIGSKDLSSQPSMEAQEKFDFESLTEQEKEHIIRLACEKLAVTFGAEILKLIPGYVSTEIDARLSFDTTATVTAAKRVMKLYEEIGIGKDRVLIKIASTWEGIEAGKKLEKEGIHCNLTLLFSLAQAIACGDAKATLISPFVGRILDWHKKSAGRDFLPHEDPGVTSVTQIYNYLKKYGYATIIMGASFRNIGEILELAGCDKLTIAPKLLEELKASDASVPKRLDATQLEDMDIKGIDMNEKTFRWMMNEDPMATEKLAEGIRKFAEDIIKVEQLVEKKLKEAPPHPEPEKKHTNGTDHSHPVEPNNTVEPEKPEAMVEEPKP